MVLVLSDKCTILVITGSNTVRHVQENEQNNMVYLWLWIIYIFNHTTLIIHEVYISFLCVEFCEPLFGKQSKNLNNASQIEINAIIKQLLNYHSENCFGNW